MLAHFPGAAGDERGSRVEEILSVIQIENGVSAVGVLVEAGRQVDNEVARVGEMLARERAMQAKAWVKGIVPGRKKGFALMCGKLMLCQGSFRIQSLRSSGKCG